MSVVLIGDGILDNFHRLKDPEKDTTSQLKQKGYHVENYASENVRLCDLRKGFAPVTDDQRRRSYHYRTSTDGKIHPLAYLGGNFQMLVDVEAEEKLVVLSVGGNDIREHKLKLIMGVKNFFGSVLTKEFRQEYHDIIAMIKARRCRLVLVSVYLPYLGEGSSYSNFRGYSRRVIDGWNNFIHELGREHDVPVIDLSRTLDSNKREHYADDMTHMSDLSSTALSKCIDYVHKNYRGFASYYLPNCHGEHVQHDQGS